MQTTGISESVTILLPQADVSLLRNLSKKMGWTIQQDD
jgi:hypothetical protein